MSVYTTVELAQLEHFLRSYDLGRPRSLIPIAAGITNTNYFLETDSGQFVLTLYEHHSDDELDYILRLQQHLAAQGVRCAAPVRDRRGACFSTLNRRPAAIIQRLPGAVEPIPTLEHRALIAAELARFHCAGTSFSGLRKNPRGILWMQSVSDLLSGDLQPGDRHLITATMNEYQDFTTEELPGGPIHGDLFHDNALFTEHSLGGIIDFDYACHDCFVFDIAVLINDWGVDSNDALDPNWVGALLDAYHRQRPLEADEMAALPMMLRLSALRFWLSRLYDQLNPLPGELTYIKDPQSLRKLFRAHHKAAALLAKLFSPHFVG